MFKHFTILLICFVSLNLSAQIQVSLMPTSVAETMLKQQQAWNNGDIDKFMVGYWQSDSLLFIGGSGVTTGYDATLSRYKKGYPDRESMGNLTFTNRSWTPLGDNSALVVGAWKLNDEVGGMYSLVWRKINNEWVIIADHSSD
tara:strand:- start:111 stop:539 length:429 start_codon:yes stop_codon:yes gene_type:complete